MMISWSAFFLSLSGISLYGYAIVCSFTCWSALGIFQVLLIMNKASLNVHVWPYVSFALGKYLGLDLLAHCTSLYLTFWEAAKQLLKGMAPFWISTRTVQVTAVPHSFDTGCPQSLSFQVFWVSSSHFNFHFLMTSNIEYLFMFFLAICKSSFVNYYFMFSPCF